MDREKHRKEYYDFFDTFVDPTDPGNNTLEKRKEYYGELKFVFPLRIETNGNSVTVFWMDGTKTTVTVSENQQDEQKRLYDAFCTAFTKRMYRSEAFVKRLVREFDASLMDDEYEQFLDLKEYEEQTVSDIEPWENMNGYDSQNRKISPDIHRFILTSGEKS